MRLCRGLALICIKWRRRNLLQCAERDVPTQEAAGVTVNAVANGRSGRLKRETKQLAELRRELCAEQDRLLVMLKEVRDELNQIGAWVGDRDVNQLILASEIVITIAERERFMEMSVARIPVVLSKIESRLLRLGELLRASQRRAWCHQVAPRCRLVDLWSIPRSMPVSPHPRH